ncbi:exonuclease domain-containing protein [Corynebacterium kalidii]
MGYFRELFSEIHRVLTTPPPDPDFDDPRSVFAVVDVETTGLNPQSSRIVEIGVSRRNARFEEVDRWETLVRPDRGSPIGTPGCRPPRATRTTSSRNSFG